MENNPDVYGTMRRRLAYGAAAGSLVLVAACTSGYPHKEGPPVSAQNTSAYEQPSTTATTSQPVVTSSQETPTAAPSATETTPDNCNSVRAARIGAYFNESYKDHIDDQLRLMRVALTPNSNVDINSDFVSWVEFAHAMEDDPEYSDAMAQAYGILQANPAAPLTSSDVLAMRIAPPPTCAPQRLTDAASHKNLQETEQVSSAVANGLLDHLGQQSSRLTQLAVDGFKHTWQQFEQELQQELNN